MPKLSYIIPCYNNEENIPVTKNSLIENEKLFDTNTEFEYVFVDDGSKDNTYNELLKFKREYQKKVKVIKLSGNFGSHSAVLAGMSHACGDCCVVLAADLQDPLDLIPKMFNHWLKGIKLVIANRDSREDPFFKKIFAYFFHFLIRKIALPNLPRGGFDLVLFDKKLNQKIVEMNERNTHQLFLLTTLNYDYVSIAYKRLNREIGKSTWTFSNRVKLFIDSFVSFSYFPLRFISFLGFFFSIGICSLCMLFNL
jgi:dolichol-phosphate mannosyltransferase